jgi:membrane protease YdiL (CAAX protease family)
MARGATTRIGAVEGIARPLVFETKKPLWLFFRSALPNDESLGMAVQLFQPSGQQTRTVIRAFIVLLVLHNGYFWFAPPHLLPNLGVMDYWLWGGVCVLVLWTVWSAAVRALPQGWQSFGLRNMTLLDAIIAAGVALFGIYAADELFYASFSDRELVEAFEFFAAPFRSTGIAETFTLVVVIVLLTPLTEEAVFRGILYGRLRKKFGFFVSALISSAVFAAMHVYYFFTGPVGLAHAMSLMFGSFLWAALYERTGNLSNAVFAHAVWNLHVLYLVANWDW